MERRRLTGGALGAVGLVLAGIQVVHAVQQTDVPVAVAVDGIPFVAMGLGVAFAGAWLAFAEQFEEYAPRIALWSVGGMLALASVSALLLFSRRVATGALARATYLTMDLVTVGALGGVLVGLYDARSRRRQETLAAERDRIEAFAGKAADVNNFGRAIHGAGSVDGVAAYVVQAVETLVDLRETAVVRVAGGRVEPVADATQVVDLDTLGTLVRETRRQAPRAVVVYDDEPPVALPPSVTTVVAALIHDDVDGAIAVVAMSADEDAVAEEDRQLLELVVGHAAATIGRLEAEPDPHA